MNAEQEVPGQFFLGDRFWSKVDKTEDCWNWRVAPARVYPTFRFEGRNVSAHRLSYADANGPIPTGMYVDHVCHNKACVRPEHLRLVTPKQNQEHRLGAQSNSTSGARGVCWDKSRQKWKASLQHLGTHIHVGHFHSVEEAKAAVTNKRLELYTHNDLDQALAAAVKP
jgi:hypothetical protein